MPAFFTERLGVVARVQDGSTTASMNFLNYPKGTGLADFADALDAEVSYAKHQAIVTRVFVKKQVNIQFSHSVGSVIYAYSFGDRMGQFAMSGHVFAARCNDSRPGISKFAPWYLKNRASNRSTPIRLGLGSDVIQCFLLSQETDVPDAATGIANWNATFATLPPDPGT